MSNDKSDLVSTFESIFCCFHEAGHVIYALSKLMRVTEVALYKNKRNSRIEGFTVFNPIHPIESFTDLETRRFAILSDIGTSYAGQIAEKHQYKLLSGSAVLPKLLKQGAFFDTKSASNYIDRFDLAEPGKPRADLKKKIKLVVESEVAETWEDITIVAHELLKERTLNYPMLKKLLLTKSRNHEHWKVKFHLIETLPSLPEIDSVVALQPYLQVFEDF
jgi:hypothetical protein